MLIKYMFISSRALFFLYILGGLLFSSELLADQRTNENVYILVNSHSSDSKKVASYYCESRGIPKGNIIELPMPKTEAISVRQYVITIHNPLIEALLKRGIVTGIIDPNTDKWGRIKLSASDHSIQYLITTIGVPLKFTLPPNALSPDDRKVYINSLSKEEASVDSELAAMLMDSFTSMHGYVKNPEYGLLKAPRKSAFRNIRVSRLDGPSLNSVKNVINDSLFAETYGLRGRAYVDVGGPYKEGNQWFRKVADELKLYNFEVEIETSKKTFGLTERTDAPAIYMGWYRKDANQLWKDKRYRVPRGAIGYHLHSFSATTLKSTSKGWVGPLLNKGFSVTYGYVYEPLLGLTIKPDLFIEQLLNGASLGEASAIATPGLSWQSVVIGDPLYRPFKVSLEEQLSLDTQFSYSNYAYLNKFYQDKAQQGLKYALTNANQYLNENPSLALINTIASTYYDLKQYPKVISLLEPIMYLPDFNLEDYILVDSLAQLLYASGGKVYALGIYKRLLQKNNLEHTLELKIINNALAIAFACNDQVFVDSLKSRLLKLGPSYNIGY